MPPLTFVGAHHAVEADLPARILAFTALSMVPSLAVFVFAERRIVGGLTGAVKG